jgi:hypothetical protein
MAEINYDVNDKELETSIDAVPAGEYTVVIESSDYVPNKQGTGMILKLTYQIIDGPQKGKKIFENLNLENVNKQAEEISRKALNSIGVAVGVNKIQDSAQLHNIPLKIDVTVKENAEYGRQNSIKKHLSINGAKPESVAGSQVPPAPGAAGKKPWERK